MENSWYRADEIKYNVDHVIQLSMYEIIKEKEDKDKLNLLRNVQDRLYEIFGISE